MGFELSVFFRSDPPPKSAAMIRGGIRMAVDGNRINRFKNESDLELTHSWNPVYIGEHLRSDLISIYDAMESIREGKSGLYEINKIDLLENWGYFIIEKISAHHVRIAYQIDKPQRIGRDHLPPESSAVGYAVDIDEFREELVRSGEEFVTCCERLGFESDPLVEDLIEKYQL